MKRFRVNRDGSKTLLETLTSRSMADRNSTTRQSIDQSSEHIDVLEGRGKPKLDELREGSRTSRSHVFVRHIKKSRQLNSIE